MRGAHFRAPGESSCPKRSLAISGFMTGQFCACLVLPVTNPSKCPETNILASSICYRFKVFCSCLNVATAGLWSQGQRQSNQNPRCMAGSVRSRPASCRPHVDLPLPLPAHPPSPVRSNSSARPPPAPPHRIVRETFSRLKLSKKESHTLTTIQCVNTIFQP